MLDPTVLPLGVAVGLLSSVIPYSLELIALRRIAARVFSILMNLEPAAAALAAMILLGEFLTLAVAGDGLRGDRQRRCDAYRGNACRIPMPADLGSLVPHDVRVG